MSYDECWRCGKELQPGAIVLHVELRVVRKDGITFHTPKRQRYDQVCMECACKDRLPGMYFAQLTLCAPKNWEAQVSDATLRQLWNDETDDAYFRRLIKEMRDAEQKRITTPKEA